MNPGTRITIMDELLDFTLYMDAAGIITYWTLMMAIGWIIGCAVS